MGFIPFAEKIHPYSLTTSNGKRFDTKKREHPVIVLFHNLKGFDGMFILNELYMDGRRVINQFSTGAKVLSFTSKSLRYSWRLK